MQYFEYVQAVFHENGNPAIAQQQIKYMRNQFDYYGLKAPVWMALSKEIFAEKGVLFGEDLKALARQCMENEHRELHYFALEMVQATLKKQPVDFVDVLEELITTKSWWDTVDWLAKLVGIHFKNYPSLILPTTERWMASGNIWLQRVSIIFQLSYRVKTDFDLMKKYILQVASSKEFFLQKGAGWALRQYARTNPAKVTEFVTQHPQLSALTKREALRRIEK